MTNRAGYKTHYPLFIIMAYCIWILLSYVVQMIGSVLPLHVTQHQIVFLLFVFLFIFISFIMTVIFFIYIGKHLTHQPGVRITCLLVCITVSIFLFLYMRTTTKMSDFLFMINTVNLIVFANLLGTWIVLPVKRMAEIVILCIVMSWTDLFSVFSGPSRFIAQTIKDYYEAGMTGPPPAGDFLLIKFAIPGLNYLQPVFGVSDWIVIVFLSACAAKFKIDDNVAGKSLNEIIVVKKVLPYFSIAGIGLFISIIMANTFNLFVPALPVISIVFLVYLLICYPDSRQLTPYDWKIIGVFSIVMIGVFAAGLIYFR